MMKYLLAYLVIVNVVSFFLMLIDKRKAKKHRWRIRESTLLGICAIGGSVGGLLGMYLLRHKTLHKQFSIGIPAMLIAQVAILGYLFLKVR